MLAKSSKTPQGRLLSLFDILSDWVDAPHIDVIKTLETCNSLELINFCTLQAKNCGAENPPMLAETILFIAHNATRQQMQSPGYDSLAHAKKAAHALIVAQTEKNRNFFKVIHAKSSGLSMAASLFLIVGVTVLCLPLLREGHFLQDSFAKLGSNSGVRNAANIHAVASNKVSSIAVGTSPVKVSLTQFSNATLTASEAVIMYAKYEQMRNGTCQFPEAIQIPDRHKAIYLEHVVAGILPTNLEELAIANFYLEKVRCNFTPMLMAHSR